jgi:hypothetical protein
MARLTILTAQQAAWCKLRRMAAGLGLAFVLAWPVAAVMQVTWAAPARAQQVQIAPDIARLMDVMGLDQIIALMREEGLSYGADLDTDMLGGMGGRTWAAQVDRIYDLEQMTALVHRQFQTSFGDADPAPLIAFFEGETGQKIVSLEVAAREAFMDDAIEEAAREAFRRVAPDLEGAGPRGIDPHLSAIDAYVAANDLIGFNVMGAMNANVLFYRGLVEGGAFAMSEAEILSDVWEQEEETRSETREWVYAFLMLAYEPLEPAQINSYADLSKTTHGRAMNRALFESFDLMYGELSRALGLALAQQMQGEDL